MEFSEWEPLYTEILVDFGFDRSEDERSARILADLLRGRAGTPADLRAIISGRDVAVCGNAPSLASEIDLIMPDQIVIAADGATTVLMANRDGEPDDSGCDRDRSGRNDRGHYLCKQKRVVRGSSCARRQQRLKERNLRRQRRRQRRAHPDTQLHCWQSWVCLLMQSGE